MTRAAPVEPIGPAAGPRLIPPPAAIIDRLAEIHREAQILRRLLAVSRDAEEQLPADRRPGRKAVARG